MSRDAEAVLQNRLLWEKVEEIVASFVRSRPARELAGHWRFRILDPEELTRELMCRLMREPSSRGLVEKGFYSPDAEEIRKIVFGLCKKRFRNYLSRDALRVRRETESRYQRRIASRTHSHHSGSSFEEERRSMCLDVATIVERLPENLKLVADCLMQGIPRTEGAEVLGWCLRTFDRRVHELKQLIRSIMEAN